MKDTAMTEPIQKKTLKTMIDNRIKELGGDAFIREYQPGWESWMADQGFALKRKYPRIPTFLTAGEVPRTSYTIFRENYNHILSALMKVLAGILSDETAKKNYLACLLPQEIYMCDIGRMPILPHVSGRADGILVSCHVEGYGEVPVPRIIEINSNCTEARVFQHLHLMGVIRLLKDLDLPVPHESAVKSASSLWYLWCWLLRNYRNMADTVHSPTLALIWEYGNSFKEAELPRAAEIFREWGAGEGIRVITGDFREVGRTRNGTWTLNGAPFHFAWRNVGPGDPGILKTPYETLLTTLSPDTFVGSDPVARLLGLKSLFAELWDPANHPLFTQAEKKAIRILIPWTAYVTHSHSLGPDDLKIKDLPEWISRNKETLVLKPERGSHGTGVTIGSEVSQETWDNTLHQALSEKWVVMAYCPLPRETLPVLSPETDWHVRHKDLYWDCSLYYEGGDSTAFIPLVRTSDAPIINIATTEPDGTPKGGCYFHMHASDFYL